MSDNFTLIRFDNGTFSAYLRRKTLQGTLQLSKSGSISIDNQNGPLFYMSPVLNATGKIPSSNASYQIFATPNAITANFLTLYQTVQVYTGGIITDVQIRTVQTLSLGTTAISAISVSQYSVVLGCSQCNLYQGSISIYNRTGFAKIGQIDGTSDNQLLGQDAQLI